MTTLSLSVPVEELAAIGEWQSFSPGLERVKKGLMKLNSPHLKWPHILVAGTNGKGTVAKNLAVGLGEKTGLFLSPHVMNIRERITLDGEWFTDSEWKQARDEIRKVWPEAKLSYFEWLLLLAVMMFTRAGVKQAVFEVGLGGRLDATNALSPQLSVLTNVGLDHQAILGNTIEKIALEKIEIARSGRMFLFPENLLSKPLIQRRLQNIGCQSKPFKDITQYEDNLKLVNLALKHLGRHPLLNLCPLPGRREIIPSKNLLIFDGAHNKPGWDALAAWIKKRYPKKMAVLFSLSNDRQPEAFLQSMGEITSHFYHWQAGFYKEVSLKDIPERVTVIKKEDIETLLKEPLLVCGSLYFVGAIRKLLV